MKTLLAGLTLALGMTASVLSAQAALSCNSSQGLSFLASGPVQANRTCRESAECNFGEFCLNGQCVIKAPGNRCEFKTDCPPAEYCVNGVCRR